MLPYNIDILFSIVAGYNASIWPWLLLTHILLAVLLVLLLIRRDTAVRDSTITGLLALVWLWVGIGFYWQNFSPFNFMAPIYAGVFVAQALLLLIFTVGPWRLRYRFAGTFQHYSGLVIVGLGVFGVALMDRLSGQPLGAARFFASGPEATVLVTLGLFLLAVQRRVFWLTIIPVIVATKISVLANFLNYHQDYIITLLAIMAVILLLKNLRKMH